MNIISVSRGGESRGMEFARELSARLGYGCLSREEMIEAATKEGITVGRLETAMLKPSQIDENLMVEKEYFQAFATEMLCGRALSEDIVYHGRSGHLLLPGVSHVLKVKVKGGKEARIETAMARLNVSWEKAKRYVESVDEDVEMWIKTYYNADWTQQSDYHLILNLDEVNVSNAATALCSLAQLPEFHATPATRRHLEDLRLASRIRVELARNERTCNTSFLVAADKGVATVSYRPQDSAVASFVEKIVSGIDGVLDVHCTMASSHILWIQERYDPAAESCDQIIDLARRWNAAVEIVRYEPDESAAGSGASGDDVRSTEAPAPRSRSRENGGIEDDVQEPELSQEDSALRDTYKRLVQGGVAGGMKIVTGPTSHLLDSLGTRVSYFLVVVGDLFVKKGHSTRIRLTRELSGAVSEGLRAPVVGMDEMKKTFLFGPGHVISLLVSLVLAAGIFLAVFHFQVPIFEFLYREGLPARIVAAACVAVLVCAFAYLYGTFTRNVLRLLRIE